MATLIQSYEQQYSVLTADITSKIGRIKSGNEENHDQIFKEIQANFEEANDLLEQLELESRGSGAGARVPALRAELLRVREEYRFAQNTTAQTNAYAMETEEYDDWGANEQQQKLLDHSERNERIGRNLSDGYRGAPESEQVGAAVQDLGGQRETIPRARTRLRGADSDLGRSSRALGAMVTRALQDRFLMAAALLLLAILLCLGLYLYIT